MEVFRSALRQSAFIRPPTLTEETLGNLSGKVVLVTGGNAGVGYQLCTILYGANATVFLAGRDASKCQAAVGNIKAAHPDSKGVIEVLHLDLADLATIKASAQDFLRRSPRLDYLCNNAGVMFPPAGSKTPQGHDLQIGTNCLGPYLITELLRPILESTAASAPANTVRVSWAGSIAIDTAAPKGGVTLDEKGMVVLSASGQVDYAQSKCGNLFLAKAFAEGTKQQGVVSTCFNPGNLNTELQRHLPSIVMTVIRYSPISFFLYGPIKGAYTELYCGFSPELTTADNGTFVAPWGQKSTVRSDVRKSMEDGTYRRFAEYCRRETQRYA